MRFPYRNLAPITLLALLCTGAAKHANKAEAATSSDAATSMQDVPEAEARETSNEAQSIPSPISYLIATYAGGLPIATAADASTYPLLTVNAVALDPAGNLFLSSSLHCVFKLDPAGNLTRVAGTGKAGFSGDGGPALSAQLNQPMGLGLDLAGNLYIADSLNHRVRKVSPDGAIATVAGTGTAGESGDNGPAAAAQLNGPQSVTVDSAGNLYIADSGNHRVRRVSAGIVTTAAGNGSPGDSGDGGPATAAQLQNPRGVAVDTAGHLYIADTGNHRIRMVFTGGIIVTVAGTYGISADGAAAGTPLANPSSVAVDPAGNIYIADTGSHRIREVSGGSIVTVAGSGTRGFLGDGGAAAAAQMDSPMGLAVDSAGNLYIADSQNQRVRKVTAAGRGISTVAGSGTAPFSDNAERATLAQFGNQAHRMAVATDRNGSVYFTDSDNHRVRRVTRDGTALTVAGNGAVGSGGDTGQAIEAQLDAPAGLATDSAGNLYIADAGVCRVRKVDANGIITTFAGTGSCAASGDGGPATSAGLDPRGMAFDSGNNLYIADQLNNRVRKVSPSGIITTVAGTGTAGYSGDGGQGAGATLSGPAGVAVDSDGNIYIADTSNSAVRELSPEGVIRTIARTAAASPNLGAPEGLAVDSHGNIFITDVSNSVVHRIASDGSMSIIAGTGAPGYTGDGGPAADAQLSGPSGIAFDAAGNLCVADQLNRAVRILVPEASRPLLSVASSHTGNFAAGQTAAFNVTVNNAALSGPTSGTVTVAETLPAGLTLVSMSGAGWNCSGSVCQRADSLMNGASYPPIMGTVNVAGTAAPQVSNIVEVSGGGSVGATAIDVVNVVGPHILSVIKTHAGNLVQGQEGVTYSITVTNRGTAATVGTVAVTDALPAGLTATGMSGAGWMCNAAMLTCTRSDTLPPGGRYPRLNVTVNVAGDAPPTVTNVAAVWSAGAATAAVANPATVIQLTTIQPTAITSRGKIAPAVERKPRTADSVALAITTATVPTAKQYQGYNTTLTATGGTPPYFWSVDPSTNVSLPEGMSLDPLTGIVSATQVNGQGGYQINALVTDSSLPSPSVASALLNFGVYSDDSYGGCPMFPPDSIYHQRIDQLPVDTNATDQIPSAYLPAPIHPDFGVGFYPNPGGIPFMRVPANQPPVNVILAGDGQIDGAGTYQWPLPLWPYAAVEGTSFGPLFGDHHILIVQTGNESIDAPQTGPCTLFETYQSTAVQTMYDAGTNTWLLSAGVHYHLDSDEIARSSNTSDTGAQDSAGIPIVPLLIRYSEVPLGVQHPLRISFPAPTNWFVWPATGCCSGTGPPQGLLYRLKAGVNWQAVCPVNTYPQAATVLQALQQYGAYMSDHGGIGFIQGVPDVRWDDFDLACIKQFHASDLEVVNNSALEYISISGQTVPYVVPAALPSGMVGTAYSAALAATGGNPAALQWSVTSGALPAGLTLDPVAGIISGTPTSAAGSPFSVGITVTDTDSAYASLPQSFSIGVTASNGPAPDLTIVSSHNGSFTQGQTGAAYSLTVTNSGSQPTSGAVTVADTLPAGLTATAIGGTGWHCALTPLSCSRGDGLPAGANFPVVTLTVTVAPDGAPTLTNTATVSGGGETNTANDQAADPTTILQLPDLTVTSMHTGNFNVGQLNATYSLTVTNVGGGISSGTVTITDSLPAGLTPTAISGGGWNCTLASLSCTRNDPLPSNFFIQPVIVTVTVATNAPASVTNNAAVSGGGEIYTANNQGTDPTTIVPTAVPDLTVSSTHAGNFIEGVPGAAYIITVTNSGGAPTNGTVTVVDTLPSGLTATTIGGAGWACALATLACTRSDALPSGGNYPITLAVTVAANAASGVTNNVAVSGGGESNTTNDKATDNTNIVQPPDLTVSSGHSGNFAQGQIGAAYTLTVSNTGTGPTFGSVIVTDALPAGLTATAIGGAGWNCTLASLTCNRGDVLSAGGSYPLTVTVNVAANAGANVTNMATVAGGSELNISNNQASDPTTIVQPPNVTVSSNHTGNFTLGQIGATYSLTVTNVGTGPANFQVTVTDALPAGLTATAIGGTNWTNCTLAALTCMRSDGLNAGASYPPIVVTVNVASNAAASLTNTVSISGGGELSTANDPTAVSPSTLGITTTSVPVATQYQSYSTALMATGGNAPYTWSVISSTGVSLPEGMSLDPASGMVTASQVNGQGGYAVTVQVADSSLPSPIIVTATLNFGVNSDTSYGGCQMFPADSIFNQRIDLLPVDSAPSDQIPSSSLTSTLYPNFGHGFYPAPGGIPFMRVPANQTASNVNLASSGQIDASGTYVWPFPAWPNAAIEGTSSGPAGNDHHMLILQSSVNNIGGPQTGACTLYETYQNTAAVASMYNAGSNTWSVSAGTHYVLNSDEIAASAGALNSGAQDSAGIPVVPLLMKYSEVPLGVQHPLRITMPSPTNGSAWPGTGCCAGSGPPQGLLYRLKASVKWQAACPVSTNPQAATVLQALQQYGAYMSDHGAAGSIQGVPDVRWNDSDLACIKNFPLSDLEVVNNSALEVSPVSGQTQPYVVPATLPPGPGGTAYSASIAAVGGNPAKLQWSISSGIFPPGLSLNASTGTISGTPTSSSGSPFSFGVTVKDTASGLASPAQAFAVAVTQESQMITFGTLSSQVYGAAPFAIGAAASSGLTVSFISTTTAVCTVSGTTVTLAAGGTCTIQARQAGNATYSAAPPVSQSFMVTWPGGSCDIDHTGSINVIDVQRIVNEALGIIPSSADLNGDGAVNIADVEIVINAALGLGCTVGSGTALLALVK